MVRLIVIMIVVAMASVANAQQCVNGQCAAGNQSQVAALFPTAANVIRNTVAYQPVRRVASLPVRVFRAKPARTVARRIFCR